MLLLLVLYKKNLSRCGSQGTRGLYLPPGVHHGAGPAAGADAAEGGRGDGAEGDTLPTVQGRVGSVTYPDNFVPDPVSENPDPALFCNFCKYHNIQE